MDNQADVTLIAACQQNDPRACRQLFDIYRDRIYALCRHMSNNAEDAEDLTQESFVWAFKNIAGFRAECSFGTWLYRIAANRCLAQRRKASPQFYSVDELAERNRAVFAEGANPEEQLVRKELVDRAEAAVRELPEKQRLLFVLGTQMGLRYREIGEVVGCSEDAVKVSVHRARKRVRDLMKPYLEN